MGARIAGVFSLKGRTFYNFDQIFASNGAIKVMEKATTEGMVRYIGA